MMEIGHGGKDRKKAVEDHLREEREDIDACDGRGGQDQKVEKLIEKLGELSVVDWILGEWRRMTR